MRQETELFKDKIEVSLEGRQVFYLFFGGALVVSLVFVLGVMVGKRVETRAQQGRHAMASAATDPLAALDQLGPGDQRSFRSALMEGDADPRYDVDIALADKVKVHEDAAKAKALAKKAAKEKRAKERAEKELAKKAAKEKAAKAKTAKEQAAKEKAAKEKAAKEQAAKEQAAKEQAAKAEGKRPARFTLQLSSFRERAEADAFHDKLKAAGYAPYVVEANVPDKGVWYRVRLGGYPSYESAIEAKKQFEDSQHIIAYVTRLKR